MKTPRRELADISRALELVNEAHKLCEDSSFAPLMASLLMRKSALESETDSASSSFGGCGLQRVEFVMEGREHGVNAVVFAPDARCDYPHIGESDLSMLRRLLCADTRRLRAKSECDIAVVADGVVSSMIRHA